MKLCEYCKKKINYNFGNKKFHRGCLKLANTTNTKPCECGCGELIPSYTLHGDIKRFKKGHGYKLNKEFISYVGRIGETNPRWNGGKTKTYHGYTYIRCADHPYSNYYGYIAEHRFVIEQFLGRYLYPQELIHHINHIKTDNRLENLILFENGKKHSEFHRLIEREYFTKIMNNIEDDERINEVIKELRNRIKEYILPK